MSYFEKDKQAAEVSKDGVIKARYDVVGTRTMAIGVAERGSLRLRQPNGTSCLSVLVNTAGGIVSGDRLSFGFSLAPRSDVVVTSVAAEKVYRGADAVGVSQVEARFTLAEGARLAWIPQETIVFDAARLRRHFVADIADTSELVLAELVVFGREAHGEHDISGHFYDSWRVRRGGRLVFADETRLDGPIGRLLARGAVAAGCRAVALLLFAGPRAATHLDATRAAIAAAEAEADGRGGAAMGGATLKDGIIVARLLASSAERLRAIVAATLPAFGVTVPRIWQ